MTDLASPAFECIFWFHPSIKNHDEQIMSSIQTQTPINLSSYKKIEITVQKNKLHHLYWNNSCLWSLIPPRSIQEVPCFSLVKSLESKGFPTEIHRSHVEKILLLLLHSPCSFIWVAPKNGRHPWRNVHNIGSNLGLLESRCLLLGWL